MANESGFLPVEARFATGLFSPRPVVFTRRLAANIERMREKAGRFELALRPHAKTHKCVRIAEKQIWAGAAGLTVAKPGEAHVFLAAGIESLTVAYPLIDERAVSSLLSRAKREGAVVRLMADSLAGARALKSAASEVRGNHVPVFIKIDVGLNRCGLSPEDERLPELAAMIGSNMDLEFAGILSHAGHAYAAGDIEGVRKVADEELRLMALAKSRLEEAGLAVPEVSIGSTPTVLASEDFSGVTEIRPGNYVFMDLNQLRLGICQPEDLSLFVVSDVVSVNDKYVIVDAGSKTLSSDAGAHGAGGPGFGLALPLDGSEPFNVVKLSEEHGFLDRQGRRIKVGQRVLIAPNHACPVANLSGIITAIDEDGMINDWPVEARGRVR